MINEQFIGSLKGLKLELDLKIGALETDIKSLKKAARQNVNPEFTKRINEIINKSEIELKENSKILWKSNVIAKLIPGRDYLNPETVLLIDDMIENSERQKLLNFLNKWISDKIYNDLESLFKLKNIKNSNSNIRALSYQLYENNGVVKRENVQNIVKKMSQENRKVLREIGVKFGRYHIFLFKLFKPNAVSLRILLWKNFKQIEKSLEPPTFGLNFVKDINSTDKEFMLLCGFEKFNDAFVRIDILERLFIHIIERNLKSKKEIKLVPEMLNLLGCNKENFLMLIKKMNYKVFFKDKDIFFKYEPKRSLVKNNYKSGKLDNPFRVLNKLNLK